MRRRTLVALLVGVMVLWATPVSAGAPIAPVTVIPNPVKHGKTLKIEARQCMPVKGSAAYVYLGMFSEVSNNFELTVTADTDGTTNLTVPITKKMFPAGDYLVLVDCILESEKGSDALYSTSHALIVKKIKKKPPK